MERVAPSDDFHCTCGRVLGDPHPSGNWMVYPNPLICPECGEDNQTRLIQFIAAQAKRPKR